MNRYRPPGKKREDFLVWLGRFVPEKGPHVAIEVARQAQVPLMLAGTIDRYVKASVSYFHDQIEPEIDHDQITYVGPVNVRQKVNLLSRAHGFLNSMAWEEPFGMVMIEAMALGYPVISFDRGAAPVTVVHGETGLLVHRAAEMVQFIPRIDQIDREALRIYVEQYYFAQVMAENYVEIYEKLMRTHGDRVPTMGRTLIGEAALCSLQLIEPVAIRPRGMVS